MASRRSRERENARPWNRAPDYWWDFADQTTSVIVQSNADGGQRIASFPIVGGNAEPAIEQADALIADLKAGRTVDERCPSTGDLFEMGEDDGTSEEN